MKRTSVIQKPTELLASLSDEKLIQAADYISFLYEKQQRREFQNGIEKLIEESGAFDFLDTDDCIYTMSDIIEK